MKKSQRFSLLEAVISTVIGMVVTFFAQVIFFPIFGIEATIIDIGWVTIIFTVLSILKNFVIRRWFHKIYKKSKENGKKKENFVH